MAQPHSQTQQRPGFPPQPQTYSLPYPPQNQAVRPQFSPQPPQHSLSYSSPSPQPQAQFSPTFTNQSPPAKRPRLTDDAPSFSPAVSLPQTASAVNGQVNGQANGQGSGNLNPGQSRPNLMLPPQQPYIKKEESDAVGPVGPVRDIAPPANYATPANTGFMPIPHLPNPNPPGLPAYDPNDAARLSVNGQVPTQSQPVVKEEERTARLNQRQDWEEARHAQHELWDPFLFGGTLNDKIKSIAHRSNLVEPQSGVLVNTQKNQPPPIVRVNGYEGATRVIKDGQSILDTREKAERLNELVKLISLSAKARLTGLIQTAARLASERRQHSHGSIPDEWADLAVKSKVREMENAASPAASAGMKRTHSQANSEAGSSSHQQPVVSAASIFAQFSNQEIKAEQARQAKRRKRTEAITAQENDATVAAEQDVLNAVAEDSKRTTKKERKLQESKVSEQQQHASTNEAARMATANIFGKFASNKKKNYSWLSGGGGATPVRSSSSTAAPTRAASVAPVKEKGTETAKSSRSAVFDEKLDLGIHARDMLLVLESDGRAAKSYVRGSSVIDDMTAV